MTRLSGHMTGGRATGSPRKAGMTIVFLYIFLSILPAHADSYLTQAYKIYFSLHPPGESLVRRDLYPFPGPVIPYGEDLPVCDAARDPASYAHEKGPNSCSVATAAAG